MAQFKDLTGRRFSRLVVIKRVCGKAKRAYWLCKCDCGNVTVLDSYVLNSGLTKSCGCLHNELLSKNDTKHGMRYTRIYALWKGMKTRCANTNRQDYKYYGGRNIKVCNDWQKFENFYSDMGKSYEDHIKIYGEKDTTLDRIDVNGNYEFANCRWATRKEQIKNRRVENVTA